jgi:16S rRNA (cytosine1402-N4)-methyltransferase
LSHHIPVLIEKIVENFNIEDFSKSNIIYIVDACFGEGGYTEQFFKLEQKYSDVSINIIGIEQDFEIYKKSKEKFSKQINEKKLFLYNTNFINLNDVFDDLEINFAHFFVFDPGISMFHIKESQKGITFMEEQPLDMRLSNNCKYSAEEVINTFPYEKLANIFYEYGEETGSRKIAKHIIEHRKKKKIKTTTQLANIVVEAIYGTYKKGGVRRFKIHPATKVFQALRIFINNELENLQSALFESIRRTIIKGRIFVVSYHSLEDRIVKNIFKEYSEKGIIERVNKKPIVPDYDEIRKNRSARSAKLRIAQKISL